MRLLILLLGAYLGYRVIKKWLLTNMPINPEDQSEEAYEAGDRSLKAVDDFMIKDPFCETYFPKRDGVHLHFEGEDFYFCSTECRDRFLAEKER
jgi:YHS domain-containing protein